MAFQASFNNRNDGLQVGQNNGFIHNYFTGSDDSKVLNPELDKKRMEADKGGLLYDSYRWVLEHDDFRSWKDAEDGQLLWIKGGPGKGKTMLICGIIDELSKQADLNNMNIAYFFCQATNNRINSATAVLRGLIFMLGKHQPLLQTYIPPRFLENENGWFELCEVIQKIIRDPGIRSTYLIVDAIDECTIDQIRLLEFLGQHSSDNLRVKWILSSRNEPMIENHLNKTAERKLQLKLNDKVLSGAVESYIHHKVDDLANNHDYTPDVQDAVKQHLISAANGTFLWVALVCQGLTNVEAWEVEDQLKYFPPGLDELYVRMLDQVRGLRAPTAAICTSILRIVTTVYRPITLSELKCYVDLPARVSNNTQSMIKLVAYCGSFVSLREGTITLVHQSAQEFLLRQASEKFHPGGIQETHHSIFLKSLQILNTRLCRDILKLNDPAASVNQVQQRQQGALAQIFYACVYWVDHLGDYFKSEPPRLETIEPRRIIDPLTTFMCNDLLHWIEALSLSENLPGGATSMLNLECLLKRYARNADLEARVQDAYRFIIHNKTLIEKNPLQVYSSAILFTPRDTMTRNQFESNELMWLNTNLIVEEGWGQCLQTLEGHHNIVNSVIFSPSGSLIASGDNSGIIRIWDTRSGQCLETLKGSGGSVKSLAFSPDHLWLASGSNGAFEIWKTQDWSNVSILRRWYINCSSVAFSSSGALLVLSRQNHIDIWDTKTWQCLHTFDAPNNANSVAFSHHDTYLALGTTSQVTEIWCTKRWHCIQTLKSHHGTVNSILGDSSKQGCLELNLIFFP